MEMRLDVCVLCYIFEVFFYWRTEIFIGNCMWFFNLFYLFDFITIIDGPKAHYENYGRLAFCPKITFVDSLSFTIFFLLFLGMSSTIMSILIEAWWQLWLLWLTIRKATNLGEWLFCAVIYWTSWVVEKMNKNSRPFVLKFNAQNLKKILCNWNYLRMQLFYGMHLPWNYSYVTNHLHAKFQFYFFPP